MIDLAITRFYNESGQRTSISDMLKRFASEFKRAFAIMPEGGAIEEEDILFLERIAGQVIKRRMSEPVLIMAESCGPVNFIGSQMIHFLKPILDLMCDTQEIERLAILLEKRESLSVFVKILERMRDEGA